MKHRLTPASVVALGLVSTTFLTGGVLMSVGAKANEYVDDVAISVEASCTLASGGGTYSRNVINTSTTEVTGNTIKALCNDVGGYALYAIGYSGNTYTGNNTKMIASIGNDYNISTGTSGPNSYWAMKLTPVSGTYTPIIAGSTADTQKQVGDTDYSNYAAVPSTFTRVAYYTSNTDIETADDPTPDGSSLTPGYKVYINGTQPAGTYTGKVKYMLLHPNTMTAGTYVVTYNANGGSGSMSSSTGLYNFEDNTLPANTFTAPSGYGFAGWCTVQEVGANPQTTCAGTSYADEGTVPASTVDSNGTLSLYAMWREVPIMQNLALSQCTTTPMDVVDSRDGQTYKVAKLADGKCWMVESLNLAGGTALDADKTDVTSDYISSFTTSNNLTKNGDTIVLPTSAESGFGTNNYSYVYNSGNKTNCGASGQNTPCYSYYSWDAATLGSGRTISTDNTDVEQSICPKGWKLPTSRTTSASNWQTTSDFYAMAHQYGLNSTTSTSESDADFYNQAGPGTTPNFLLAGDYGKGSFHDGGSYGNYWSSTSVSGTYGARFLRFGSSYVDSANSGGRASGFSVRCLLR